MRTRSLLRAFAFVASVAALAFGGSASADPPSRVARLGYVTGSVSFSPAGENDWVQASINRPLTTGDRLWADPGARAEIQVGGAMIRMNAGTSVSILNLDDRIAQLQLTQGILNVRVRRLEPNQVFEVDTPNLAFVIRRPGEYRIEVDPERDGTTIFVRNGQGEVYGGNASYVIDSRQPYRFWGTDLREYEYVDAPRFDEFDRWSSDRDRGYENSVSARYVSPDVIGYHDLDTNGTWRVDATYGNVWFPNRVEAGWAPYRDGHWAWIDPWGWTWVDDAPWGFAVSHYGRWTNLRGTWGWVPGPVRTRAYYAPALVVFIGGANFQLSIASGNIGGVAWFPLGPREVYQPAYPVSRGYFGNINRSNTVINNTVINNTYNNINVTNTVYVNRQVPGAVVAVPTTAFVQSQSVSRAAVRVPREMIVSAPLAVVAPVAPTDRSVRGAAAQADRPPARALERPVVARTAPPAARVGFSAQQQQLTAQPGRPLDDAARRELKPAAAVPAPAVKLVTPTKEAAPVQRPPQVAARGRPDERKAPTAPAMSGAPGAPTQSAVPAPPAPPAPAAQAPEQRGRSDQRGKAEQRPQPGAPPPAAPKPAAQAPAASTPVAPPAPTAQPPAQQGKSDLRGKAEQRAQPVTPPPTATQPPASAPAASPQAAPPAPTAQPPEQRGKSDQPGKAEQRVQPVAPPTVRPQGAAQPRVAPPQVVPPAPAAQSRTKPEPAPAAAKQAERRPPVAAPESPLPQAQPSQKAQPRGQEPKPSANPADDKKLDSDAQRRDEDERKK
jgi:hypothetical protein